MPPSTREQVLEVAEELFAEKGFAAVGIREITQRAGVNVAAIHYHFGSKEELYIAMLRRYLEPVNAKRLARMAEVLAVEPRPPFEAFLEAFLMPMIDIMFDESGLVRRRLVLAGRVNVEAPELMATIQERYLPEVRDRFLEGVGQYFPELPEPIRRGRMLFAISLVFGALPQLGRMEFIGQGQLPIAQARALIQDMMQFLAAGFRAPVETSEGPAGQVMNRGVNAAPCQGKTSTRQD